MILPGHVACAVLCRRYLRCDLRLALAASLLPDVIDKLLYHVLHITPNSRLPMHTLLAWLASTALVALIAWLGYRVWGIGSRVQGVAINPKPHTLHPIPWLLAYGLHLLCDSPLAGGDLPFLWPWRAYDFTSPIRPWAFLFGLDDWPIHTLIVETLLVIATIFIERRHRARQHQPTAAVVQ